MGDSEDEGDPGQPLLAGHVNRSTTASPVPAAATAAATSAPSATTISDKRGLHHIQEGQGHNGDDWDQHHARDRAGECTWLHCVGIECSRRTAVKVGVLAGALAGVVAVITLFVPQLIHGHNVHSWPHWANAACDVYCKGDLLDTAQRRNVFPNDSKYFVDMPMYDNPQTVLTDFDNLGDGDLEGFIQRHFADPGSDLDRIDPPDFDAEGPWWLTTLNSTTHSWAKGVHKIWRELTRKVTDAVQARPERHSLLWVPNNIVVPGGRFREAYYWDSYWIVRGLVSSGMNTTAEGVVRNFGHLIDTFGFVPNGGRVYYLTRSQPPFLSEMVRFLYEELKDVRFLKEMLPKLDREYRYWMQQGDTGHAVRVVLDGTSHVLNRFVADTSDPRPESYREDIATARDEKDPDHVYQELASGAETGWDFSSRWLLDVDVLGSIRTSRLAPADLNAVGVGSWAKAAQSQPDTPLFCFLFFFQKTTDTFLDQQHNTLTRSPHVLSVAMMRETSRSCTGLSATLNSCTRKLARRGQRFDSTVSMPRHERLPSKHCCSTTPQPSGTTCIFRPRPRSRTTTPRRPTLFRCGQGFRSTRMLSMLWCARSSTAACSKLEAF
eukprot:m.295176 g.295176  ORF g.295176 m.295176 type:complete len:606 (-) comp19510_c0_seq19:451-2268(-)